MRSAFPQHDPGADLLGMGMMHNPMEDDFQAAAKRARLDTGEPPSEAEILRLVSQRESMRQARRFAESDSIREELRSMGVELYDKEKEWRSRDGRRGVLFTAGAQECMLADVEIQEMVREREEARKSKEWERADALRDELRSKGVELDDRDSSWRTSSGRYGKYSGFVPVVELNDNDSSWRPSNGRFGKYNSGFVQSPSEGMQSSINGATVRKLVAERERLRASQEFDAADELRRQLASLGVEIFDNERLWRTTDGQQGIIITGGHEVDCTLADQEISVRVSQREEARSQKNWTQADAIRDDLRQNGVELLDNQRVWCTTDGRHGAYSGSVLPSTLPVSNMGRGSGGGGANNTAMQVAAGLASLLVPQVQQRGQPAANQGTLALQGRLPSSAVTSSPSAQSITTGSIVALVAGREKAREKHDWEAADAIRADLRSHGVDVWDKEKVWRANDGRNGVINRPLGTV